MKILLAKDTTHGFGKLIHLRAKPVAVAKYDRPVVVVMAVEEFERLKPLDTRRSTPALTNNQESSAITFRRG
jgi:PHD/YefM family antitoxin component YafN of YafNO toxin-antitoxin module